MPDRPDLTDAALGEMERLAEATLTRTKDPNGIRRRLAYAVLRLVPEVRRLREEIERERAIADAHDELTDEMRAERATARAELAPLQAENAELRRLVWVCIDNARLVNEQLRAFLRKAGIEPPPLTVATPEGWAPAENHVHGSTRAATDPERAP